MSTPGAGQGGAGGGPPGAGQGTMGWGAGDLLRRTEDVRPQYPAMPTVSATRAPLKALGATGTAIMAGIIQSEEYNPDWYWRKGVEVVERMVRNEPQVNAVRNMIELPIRRAHWTVVPASDNPKHVEQASFIQTCLFDEMCRTTLGGRAVYQKWDDTLRHILMHLTYGFMAFEIVYRQDDGWTKWAQWLPLLPRTVWRWWVGPDNELAGIQQWTYKGYAYGFVDIPSDKMLLFSNRMEGQNYEGVSLFRSCYKNWWYKENYEKIDAIGIERNAVVPPIVYLPESATESDQQAGMAIAQNVRANENLGITLPHGWEFSYPKNNQRYASQTLPAIQYHDIMIARNALAQFINLGSTETGAYSLNDSQQETFLESLQTVCEYIEDTVNSQAIRRLVDYNFSEGETQGLYPRLQCDKLTTQDIGKLSESLKNLSGNQQGLLTPDPVLEDWLRKSFGIPAAAVNPVETTNPGSPATPNRPSAQPGQAQDHQSQGSQNKPVQQADTALKVKTPGPAGQNPVAPPAVPAARATMVEGYDTPAARILAEEALMRLALVEAQNLDAVEESWRLYNPYPRQRGGLFGFGSGAGVHGGVHGGLGAAGGAAHHENVYGGLGFSHHGGGGGGSASGAAPKGGQAGEPPRLSLAQYKAARAAAQAAGDKEKVRALAKQYPTHQNRVNKERHNANKSDSEFMQGFKARQAAAAKAAAKANSQYYYRAKQDYLREDVINGDHRLTTYQAFRGQMMKAVHAEDHEYVAALNNKYRAFSRKLRATAPEVERAVREARRVYKANHPSNSRAARQASKEYKARQAERAAQTAAVRVMDR